MVKRRAELLIVVAALLGTSGTLAAQGSSAPACVTGATAQMAPFDTARVSDLVGAYEVVMFDTTNVRGASQRHAGKLALWMQDSVPVRRGSTAKRTQRQYLVGSYDAAAPDTGDVWRRMANRSSDAPGAFWSDGFIRLGEFGPKSGISLYLRHVGAGEFRGMWSTNPGLGIVVDFTGEREPDEAGFFCARRMR